MAKIGALVGVLVVALLGCGTDGPGPLADQRRTINGEVTLFRGFDRTGAECVGKDGFGDVSGGTSVTAKDEKGTVIGTAKLDAGRIVKDTSGFNVCRFSFVLSDLPDVGFYTVETSNRKGLTYSKADLAGAGWTVDLALS